MSASCQDARHGEHLKYLEWEKKNKKKKCRKSLDPKGVFCNQGICNRGMIAGRKSVRGTCVITSHKNSLWGKRDEKRGRTRKKQLVSLCIQQSKQKYFTQDPLCSTSSKTPSTLHQNLDQKSHPGDY